MEQITKYRITVLVLIVLLLTSLIWNYLPYREIAKLRAERLKLELKQEKERFKWEKETKLENYNPLHLPSREE